MDIVMIFGFFHHWDYCFERGVRPYKCLGKHGMLLDNLYFTKRSRTLGRGLAGDLPIVCKAAAITILVMFMASDGIGTQHLFFHIEQFWS